MHTLQDTAADETNAQSRGLSHQENNAPKTHYTPTNAVGDMSSGTRRANGTASAAADHERLSRASRMNTAANGGGSGSGSAHASFRSERSERSDARQQQRERERERERERDRESGSNAHKRSASGNPRTTSRTQDDRHVEERRTERTYVTQLETLVQRTRSPERGDRRGDKGKPKEDKSRSAETKPKEAKVETPSGEIAVCRRDRGNAH